MAGRKREARLRADVPGMTIFKDEMTTTSKTPGGWNDQTAGR
jgi:hypothetical protein